MQPRGDDGVVIAVAREPVDFVDDDVVDRLLGDVAEQPLEFRPVGRAGTFACIDEFADHLGAEALDLAQTGGPLSRD